MADNVLGRIILEAGAKAGAMTGGGAPPISGLLEGDSPPSGGGGSESSSKEAHANRFRKGIEGFNKKSLDFAKAQPKWFTSIFKKMGIQMGGFTSLRFFFNAKSHCLPRVENMKHF